MPTTVSYIKIGNENHPIDAVTVNGLTLTSTEKATWNGKQDALTFDSVPTENSNNPVKSGGVYKAFEDNELVVAAALNELNERISDISVEESDPVFSSSAAAGISASNISNWNSAYSTLTSSRAKNLVLATPASASGAPTFRALSASDIPSLSGTYELVSNKVSVLTSAATDAQYPTAKCMYDIIGNLESVLMSL